MLTTILTTHEKPEVNSGHFTQALHEQLKISIPQRTESRQMLLLIRERDKAILLMHLSLMHTTNRPLP